MAQHYSNPARASNPHALPDVETFLVRDSRDHVIGEDGEPLAAGWYWQACFPGCLPDSEPVGPFDTEDAALADAQDGAS